MEAGWDALAALPLSVRGTPGTGLGRRSERGGGLGAAGSFLGRKYFWPKGCPALAPSPQPGAGSQTCHGPCRTASISHAWENAQQLSAQGRLRGTHSPSLPSHGSRTVGYVQDPFLLVSGPCRSHAGASPMPVDGLHHAAQGWLLGDRQALALQKFTPVPTNS